MYARFTKLVCRVLALAFVASVSITLLAQDSAKPAKASGDDSAPKWDIFLGYSYLTAPRGTVNGYGYLPVNYATIASVSRYFNKNVGVQFEGDAHILLPEGAYPTPSQPNNDFSGGSGGLIFRFPAEELTPFLHALVGAEQIGSYYQPDKWGPAFTVGVGMDAATPLWNHHLAVRVFQADYQYAHENFGTGETEGFRIVRVSAGLVYRIGPIAPPPPVTLVCSASPAMIFPGDPVTVTATAGNLDPKLNAVYSWTGDGVTGSGTTATVATGSLAAGSYTVKAEVKEGKPGKEGLKPGQTADCSASLTVKAYEPPTISCSASPSIINPGDKSAITATGVSPQNRPLTYGYSAASGTVSGSGATASFDSTGAAPGAIGINCNVTDDKNQTATASTSVTITAPPPPGPSPEQVQLETRLALHSVFFPTDQPRIEKSDGGLLASQEGTLTTLASDFKKYLVFKPDAHLTLSGHADVRGSVEYNQALSERRVARTKQFLVEQGVPEGSIDTRGLGKEEELTADQVKDLVEQNPDLGAPEREKVLRNLSVIVLAQNRRVDVTLSTTGQQSVRLYPFNAADSVTLIDERNLATRKKTAAVKK